MEIFRFIQTIPAETDVVRDLRSAGIGLEELNKPHIVIEIGENDPRVVVLEEIAKRYDKFVGTGTSFSAEDLERSDYILLRAAWDKYSAQPEHNDEYLRVTYDLSSYCPYCSTGYRQNAPFQLRGEPRWGKHHAFHLEAIRDAIFVKTDYWELRLKSLGIDVTDVIQNETHEPLKSVVQLRIPTIVPLDLNDPRLRDVAINRCPVCGQVRMNRIPPGYAPRPAFDPGVSIFQSEQFFGAYAKSYRATYITNDVYQALKADIDKDWWFSACLPPKI